MTTKSIKVGKRFVTLLKRGEELVDSERTKDQVMSLLATLNETDTEIPLNTKEMRQLEYILFADSIDSLNMGDPSAVTYNSALEVQRIHADADFRERVRWVSQNAIEQICDNQKARFTTELVNGLFGNPPLSDGELQEIFKENGIEQTNSYD